VALPGSGAMSIAMLQAEFSTGANSLSQYYRGGGIVPNTGTNVNVPTSGTISLSNFYNAAASTPLSATLSPSYSFKTRATTGILSTGTITCNPTGGNGTYTYSWSVLSNNAGGGLTNGTTNQTNNFNTGSFAVPNTRQTVLRCTVTSGGDTVNVDITCDWEWV
jgi:hypothetical protein